MAFLDEGNPEAKEAWVDVVLLICSLHALLPCVRSIFGIFVGCMGHCCIRSGGTQVCDSNTGGPMKLLHHSVLCRFGHCSRRLFSKFGFGATELVIQFLINVLCIPAVWITLILSTTLGKAVQVLAVYHFKKLKNLQKLKEWVKQITKVSLPFRMRMLGKLVTNCALD